MYNICPDVGEIAETLAKKGLESVEKINLKLGRPFKVMLAQRIKELEELPEKIPADCCGIPQASIHEMQHK